MHITQNFSKLMAQLRNDDIDSNIQQHLQSYELSLPCTLLLYNKCYNYYSLFFT